ncbi:MAG: cytochrome b/b6 domain-containing protein [Bdellovibrio sp.]
MENKIKVWDIYIRFYHWVLVALVFANFLFTEEGEKAHELVGYAAVFLVLIRLVWGFTGSPYARFREFFPYPSKVINYVQKTLSGENPRTLGHNPLASIMMLTMLALILLLGLSGWLMSTDIFFGSDFMEEAHEAFANLLMACVGLHAVAAIFDSYRHRENLALSMITGYKRK